MPFSIVLQEQLPGTRGAFKNCATKVDAAGNHYFVYGDEVTENANLTMVRVRKYAPDGTLLGQWVESCPPPHKIDAVSASHSGGELVIDATTHTYEGPRIKAIMSLRLDVGFVTNPEFEAEEGGPNAFVGGGNEPPPGGGEVDYERIKRDTRDVVNAVVNTDVPPVVESWARQTIGNIIPKVWFAFINGLDETNQDETARRFRDAFFRYFVNASANPLANVLGGHDEWGEARQDELIAIIQEAIGEPPPAPKKAKP